jgi:hypothetical protein
MRLSLTRIMLFLSLIKGPRVVEWVTSQVEWIQLQLRQGAREEDEYLSATVIQSFKDTYTDTMSLQRAKNELLDLKMDPKEGLDAYISKFEQLARHANYILDNDTVIDMFCNGLPSGLFENIVMNNNPVGWTDWVRAARRHQQVYLLVQARKTRDRGGRTGDNKKSNNPPRTKEQFRNAFSRNNQKTRDPNAMDTTPGRVRARQITTEEREALMKAGKCFNCRKQGHLSRDCPTRQPTRARVATTSASKVEEVEDTEQEPAVRSGTVKHTSDDIIKMINECEDWDKDAVIQKVFMNQDF